MWLTIAQYALGAIIAIIFLIYLYLVYLGVHKTVQCQYGVLRELKFVFIQNQGLYQNIGSVFQELCSEVSKQKINKVYSPLGIYYDDPNQTPADQQRAIVGITTENLEEAEIARIIEKKKMRQAQSQECNAVWCSFPCKNSLQLRIAIFKCYKALQQFMTKEELVGKIRCSVELMKNKQMEFYFPISKQEQFFLYREQ